MVVSDGEDLTYLVVVCACWAWHGMAWAEGEDG